MSSIPYFDANFGRLLNDYIFDSEEVREDTQVNLINTYSYRGMALDGTSVNASAWTVVRYGHDSNGLVSRIQCLRGVAWASRVSLNWPS